MKSLILYILFIQSSLASTFPNFGGNGLDIDHDPAYRNRLKDQKVEVPNCSILRNNKYFHLNKKNNSLAEVIDLIKTTESGRDLLNSVYPQIKSGKLIFKELNSYERQRRGINSETAALYDATETPPAIYVNSNDELGLLANFLFHEMVHATDKKISHEYKNDILLYEKYKSKFNELGLNTDPYKELSTSEISEIEKVYQSYIESQHKNAYRAERLAFDEQGYFTSELLEEDSCFSEYLNNHRKLNKLKLYEVTPDSHIFNSYDIDPNNI